jgi:hypothetical protein
MKTDAKRRDVAWTYYRDFIIVLTQLSLIDKFEREYSFMFVSDQHDYLLP